MKRILLVCAVLFSAHFCFSQTECTPGQQVISWLNGSDNSQPPVTHANGCLDSNGVMRLASRNQMRQTATVYCNDYLDSATDIFAACNKAIADLLTKAPNGVGTVIILPGTYNNVTTTLDTAQGSAGIVNNRISIQGGDGTNPDATIVNYTGTGDAIKFRLTGTGGAFNPDAPGTIKGFKIIGTSAAVGAGIHFMNGIFEAAENMVIQGFTNASGVGIYYDNSIAGLYSENDSLYRVHVINNTKGIRFLNSSGGSTSSFSFGWNSMYNVYIETGAGVASQTCISVDGAFLIQQQWLGVRCIINGQTSTALMIQGLAWTAGTPSLMSQGQIFMDVECINFASANCTAATGLNIGTGAVGNQLLYFGVIAENTAGITDTINAAATVKGETSYSIVNNAQTNHFESILNGGATAGWLVPTADNAIGIGVAGAFAVKSVASYVYNTGSNCQLGGATGTVSPAGCGSAAAGRVAIPATTTSYTVNTTAVTAASTIIVDQIYDNTGLTSATCNQVSLAPIQSARVAGTSFTMVTNSQASVTCIAYWIIN